LLDEVIGWEEELKDYYAQWLRGEELERVRATVSTARMR